MFVVPPAGGMSGVEYSHSRHVSTLLLNQIAKKFQQTEFYFLYSDNNLTGT